jgi:hypothetical protein
VTGSDYDGIEIGHGFAIKTGLASTQYRSCPRPNPVAASNVDRNPPALALGPPALPGKL